MPVLSLRHVCDFSLRFYIVFPRRKVMAISFIAVYSALFGILPTL